MPTPEDKPKEGELIQAPPTMTADQAGSKDDAYIFNYVNNAKGGKTNALRCTGWEGDEKYIRQEAQRIHNRLRPRILAVQKEMFRDVGSLSYQQLEGILKMEVTETGIANMLGAIKMGVELSGSKPEAYAPETKKRAINQTRDRIAALQKQIEDTTRTPQALPSPV